MKKDNLTGYSPLLFGSRLRIYLEKRDLNANQA